MTGSVPGNRANQRSGLQQVAYEAFIVTALCGLRQRSRSAAAQRRARPHLDLPTHTVAFGRLQLPPSAVLFGLWRRSDRTFRPVGWRMDDAGAAIAVSTLGYLGDRQCAADNSVGRAMVSAMALRALARRQRALKLCCTAFTRTAHCCRDGNRGLTVALVRCHEGGQSMRWKISPWKVGHGSHDPRHLDLIAALALVIVIVAACRYLSGGYQPPSTATFIVPSQSVRW